MALSFVSFDQFDTKLAIFSTEGVFFKLCENDFFYRTYISQFCDSLGKMIRYLWPSFYQISRNAEVGFSPEIAEIPQKFFCSPPFLVALLDLLRKSVMDCPPPLTLDRRPERMGL